MTLKDKKQKVKELLDRAYARQLQLKYAKNIYETIFISATIAIEIEQATVIASQPIPKFEKGSVAQVHDKNLPEIIIDKNGRSREIPNNRR